MMATIIYIVNIHVVMLVERKKERYRLWKIERVSISLFMKVDWEIDRRNKEGIGQSLSGFRYEMWGTVKFTLSKGRNFQRIWVVHVRWDHSLPNLSS